VDRAPLGRSARLRHRQHPVPPSQQQAITTAAAFPISDLGTLPESATPLEAPYVEGAGDGYRLRAPYWVRVTRRGGAAPVPSPRTASTGPKSAPPSRVGPHGVRGPRPHLLPRRRRGVRRDRHRRLRQRQRDLLVRTGLDRAPPGAHRHRPAGRRPGPTPSSWPGPTRTSPARYTVLRATAPTDRTRPSPPASARSASAPASGTRTRPGRPGTTYHYAVAKTNPVARAAFVARRGRDADPFHAPTHLRHRSAFANHGAAFRHLLTASHEPVRFTATGLPGGLRVDGAPA
jgi:hypothetical protein